ncbi:hypothetical protein ACFLTS_01040 [Chloroflexota bacterium]
MLFKKKCRHCGANNPKDSLACIRCGKVFFSNEIESELRRGKAPRAPTPINRVEKVREERVEENRGHTDILDRFMKNLGVEIEEPEEEAECTCMECGAVFPVHDEEEIICPKCGAMLEIEEEAECTCMECGAVFPVDDEEEEIICPKCGATLEIEED